MNNLNININKYTQETKATKFAWQQQALDYIEFLDNPVKSQIFKWAKLKEGKLKTSITYMKEKGINNFKYLCKMMSL